jgi:PAS domain S-box-containing protein
MKMSQEKAEVVLDPIMATVLSIISLVATAIISIVSAVVFPTISALRKELAEAKEEHSKKLTALETKYDLQIAKYEKKIEALEAELELCEKEREDSIRRSERNEYRLKQLEMGIEGHVYAKPDPLEKTLKIVFVDHGMLKLFGYSRSEFLGMPVEKIVAPSDRPRHLFKVSQHDFSIPFQGSVRGIAIDKSGEQFPVIIDLASTTYNGEPVQSAIIRKV